MISRTVRCGQACARAEGAAAHPEAGFQRLQVARLHVGDESSVAAGAVAHQGLGLADGMKALAAVAGMSERLVDVHVVVAAAHAQVGDADRGRGGGIPGVRSERTAVVRSGQPPRASTSAGSQGAIGSLISRVISQVIWRITLLLTVPMRR